MTWNDREHRADPASADHQHRLYDLTDVASRSHRHSDLESEVSGLRVDLTRAFASMADLAEDLNMALERISALERERQAKSDESC